MQPAALPRVQPGGDRLADEVVGGCPALLAEPQQAGPGQLGELTEHGARVLAGRGGERARRCLPGQQRNQPEQLRRGGGQPLHPAPDGPPLAVAAELGGQLRHVRTAGRAAGDQLAQHLGDRERGAVGGGAQRGAQRGVVGQPVDGRRRQRAQRELGDRARTGDPGHGGRVELVGAVREHHREPRQPVQHRGQQGDAGRIGPLQVVDDEHGALPGDQVQHPQPTGQQQRPPALTVQRGWHGGELREQPGQRVPDPRRQRVDHRRVRGQRLGQQGPGQPPRLGPLTGEGPRGDHRQRRTTQRLGDQPRLAHPRGPAHRHDLPKSDRRAECGQLGVAADERQRVEGGPAGRRGHRGRGGHAAPQQLQLQSLQRRGQVGAQLVGQPAPERGQLAQRAGPVPGRRQRPGQRGHGRLAQRLGRDRVARGGGGRRGVAQLQRGGRGQLQRLDPGPAQPLPRATGPLGVGVLGQRLAPERECRRGGGQDLGRRARGPGPAQRGVELGDVQADRAQRVAGRPGDDRRRLAHRPSGPVDQHVQVGHRVGRQPVRPQHVGQRVVRHQVGPAHREHPQQGAYLAPAERRRRDLLAVAAHLEPPEQLQVHPRHAHIVLAR